jgi:hypothetical protein
MKTTIVYNTQSGTIVHVHAADPEARGGTRDVLRFVNKSVDRSDLATVMVDSEELKTGGAYRVNPQTKRLEPSKSGTSSSAGVRRLKT